MNDERSFKFPAFNLLATYLFPSALIYIIVNSVLLWTCKSPYISEAQGKFNVPLLKPIKLALLNLKSQQLYVK